LFCANELIKEVSTKENAIPFDVAGVEPGHVDGHCSFVSILRKYGLKDPVLLALADVVNVADINTLDASPYAPGLEVIAQGYSLLFTDDLANTEKQFIVYDALYACFRKKVG
jgi:hypothetical protein